MFHIYTSLFRWQSILFIYSVYNYASSEFRRDYVPLWVLFRKWGMKGVCLRKRWGKCYRMRCIVKFNILACIEWISTLYYIYSWVKAEIIHSKEKTVNCAIIYPFLVNLKLGGYWNKLKNTNEMNVCNNESIWIINWNFSMYYWLSKWTKSFTQLSLYEM